MLRFRESKIDYDKKTITLVFQQDDGHKMYYTYGVEFATILGGQLLNAVNTYHENAETYGRK